MPIRSVVEERADATPVARRVSTRNAYAGEECFTAQAVGAGGIDLPAGRQSLGGAAH